MSQATLAPAPRFASVTPDKSVRPCQVRIPDQELADLRRRILAARFPEKETVADQAQGTPLATLQALARYWANEYDWRKLEARLNALPQLVTTIDGLDIHFIHVRSKHPGALPVILAHGWPGSVTHYLRVVDPLVDPTGHGGSVEDAFDVVVPSMPGYGFSGKPSTTGWDPVRIGRAWVTLMNRLGYARFVAQGGDWGALVVDHMGADAAPGLLGIHTNMPGAVPPEINAAAAAGRLAPPGLSDEERAAYDRLVHVWSHVAYAQLMATRPQSLAALADSPIGLAAFILDLEERGLTLYSRVFAGQEDSLTRDDVLDNITLFWVTNTAISAARLYWENKANYFDPKGVKIPVAVSAFPDELFVVPRSWAERAYPNLIYYNKLGQGGHFPAWEQPELFVKELRAAFRPLR